MADEEHKLHNQIRAATALRESLKATGDDEDLIRDMIEGETSLHEMIDRVVLSMDEDEMLVTGLEARASELSDRKKRLEDRIGRKRAMIEQAMVVGEIQKLERPTFTLSLRKTPPKIIIEDEAAIPSQFWKAASPTLDKKALADALNAEAAAPIPGASLSNGGISLTKRNK
jgi:hypothetical protein